MDTKRLLIDYLPPFIREFLEIRHIMSTEQPEIDDIWEACQTVLDEQFITSTSENGIKRWENMIGITPKDTDSLEERRFKILARMNQELPYTMTKLEESLKTICGEGNFSIDLQPDKYHIEIKLGLSNAKDYQETVALLNKMIPANLTQHVQIMFNSHDILDEYENRELAVYTHEDLKNRALQHLLSVVDDGNGNVIATGSVFSVTDDRNGNVSVNGLYVISDENKNIVVRGYE